MPAKNWMVAEAAEAIRSGDKEAIVDMGRRFPLATHALTKAVTASPDVMDLLKAMPEYNTMNKVNKALMEGVVASAEPVAKETTKKVENNVETKPEPTENTGVKPFEKMSAPELWNFGKDRGFEFKSTKKKERAQELISAYGTPDSDAATNALSANDNASVEEEKTAPAKNEGKKPAKGKGPYEGKGAKELWILCKKQGITLAPKQDRQVYIDALENAKKPVKAEKAGEDDWSI